MSYVNAAPEMMTAAATDLAAIGSTLDAAHLTAATSTTQVLAAAGDEVSAAIAGLFSTHGQQFRALSAQAASFHAQFVQAFNNAGNAYAAAEAANMSPLAAVVQGAQSLAVFSPVTAATGRPLIGNGANATTPGATARMAASCGATAATAPTAPTEPARTAGTAAQGESSSATAATPATAVIPKTANPGEAGATAATPECSSATAATAATAAPAKSATFSPARREGPGS